MQSAQVSALAKSDPAIADDLVEALANLLTFAAGQFNVGKNLSDVQLALLAQDMIERYWHWRFDEFSYVLREAVAGRYGTSYDRIDAPTVHGWCLKYESERGALLESAAERQHKAHRLAEMDRDALLPAQAMPHFYLRAKLEGHSDDELRAGICYYLAHPTAALATVKKELAESILAERADFAQSEANRLPTTDEKEQQYEAWRANWLAEKVAKEAQETGAHEVGKAA